MEGILVELSRDGCGEDEAGALRGAALGGSQTVGLLPALSLTAI